MGSYHTSERRFQREVEAGMDRARKLEKGTTPKARLYQAHSAFEQLEETLFVAMDQHLTGQEYIDFIQGWLNSLRKAVDGQPFCWKCGRHYSGIPHECRRK